METQQAEIDPTTLRVPFGKYEGRLLQDVPASYLSWGVRNLNDGWAATFKNELKRRGIK